MLHHLNSACSKCSLLRTLICHLAVSLLYYLNCDQKYCESVEAAKNWQNAIRFLLLKKKYHILEGFSITSSPSDPRDATPCRTLNLTVVYSGPK